MGTGLGEVTFTPPLAVQERLGVKHPVGVAYELRGKEYGFRLSDYDPMLPVLIDPLQQATYLGGSDDDVAFALAIHPTSGDVYVAGLTASTDFPGTTGGAQTTNGGGTDAFVARLNTALTTLTQATYLGGSDIDIVFALAIHPTSGDVYVAGQTFSTNLPGTTGGAQTTNGGGIDGFVARLNAALTTLTQATYLGGSGGDYALAIHPTSGNVYVAGQTFSANFPGTIGGAQATFGGSVNGGSNAFVARLNTALTTLSQATYLGGSVGDLADAMAVQPTSGDIYVAGQTLSANFPGTTGGAQATFVGSGEDVTDAFVARLTADLAAVSTTSTPTNTPTGSGAASVPTLLPGPFLFLALALASVALLLMRKSP